MNADGSGVTRLTNDPALDGYPAWSPGSKIVFQCGNLVCVINADGSGLTTLREGDDPAWSPNQY